MASGSPSWHGKVVIRSLPPLERKSVAWNATGRMPGRLSGERAAIALAAMTVGCSGVVGVIGPPDDAGASDNASRDSTSTTSGSGGAFADVLMPPTDVGSSSSGGSASSGGSGSGSSSGSSNGSSSGAPVSPCTTCASDSDCATACGPPPQTGDYWCCIRTVSQCATQSYPCRNFGSSGSGSSSSGGGRDAAVTCGMSGQPCCAGMMCTGTICFANTCL
jgi:hypothetical protein